MEFQTTPSQIRLLEKQRAAQKRRSEILYQRRRQAEKQRREDDILYGFNIHQARLQFELDKIKQEEKEIADTEKRAQRSILLQLIDKKLGKPKSIVKQETKINPIVDHILSYLPKQGFKRIGKWLPDRNAELKETSKTIHALKRMHSKFPTQYQKPIKYTSKPLIEDIISYLPKQGLPF